MDTLELTTEGMAYGGAALARHGGRVLFVPYALPGERVRVRLHERGKRVEVELLAVLEASPDRVEPPCPHFGPHQCGGCHWQHARYEAQLRYKTEIVREQLQRIGKVAEPPVRPCLGMAEPWAYRNHVQLHAAPNGALGFVRADGKGIEPIRTCLVMNGAIFPLFEAVKGRGGEGERGRGGQEERGQRSIGNDQLSKSDAQDSSSYELLPAPMSSHEAPRAPMSSHVPISKFILRGSERTGERLVVVEGGDGVAIEKLKLKIENCSLAQRDGQGRVTRLRGEPSYRERLGGREWRIHANSFFQVNTEQAERLLAEALALAGPLRGDEVVIDSYAGSGLFGLSLAARVGRVFLVESHPTAVADARRHVRGLDNVSVIHAPTEVALAAWERHGPPPDLVLLDPPRAGCKEAVLRALGKMGVPTIIYIACDPSTQARDVRRLMDEGYILDVVQPVDLFPQTYHIEAIARLRRLPT